MTPPTTDELLRLARKAKPGFTWEVLGEPGEIDACVMAGDFTMVDVVSCSRAREALHAALLVLAGELDVTALLAERDQLRSLCAEAIEEIRLVSPMTAREFAAQLARPRGEHVGSGTTAPDGGDSGA